jgi:aminoglycoside/choline kinase family phosphotransferase
MVANIFVDSSITFKKERTKAASKRYKDEKKWTDACVCFYEHARSYLFGQL